MYPVFGHGNMNGRICRSSACGHSSFQECEWFRWQFLCPSWWPQISQSLTTRTDCHAQHGGFCGTLARDLRLGRNTSAVPDLSQCNGTVGEQKVMSKEYEYRAYAGACVDLANKATRDDDRKHLLAMAEAWLDLIDRVQRPGDEPNALSLDPALRAKLGSAM
jgi:hypothetical protein